MSYYPRPELVDNREDGEVWVEFGTDSDSDMYYKVFIAKAGRNSTGNGRYTDGIWAERVKTDWLRLHGRPPTKRQKKRFHKEAARAAKHAFASYTEAKQGKGTFVFDPKSGRLKPDTTALEAQLLDGA